MYVQINHTIDLDIHAVVFIAADADLHLGILFTCVIVTSLDINVQQHTSNQPIISRLGRILNNPNEKIYYTAFIKQICNNQSSILNILAFWTHALLMNPHVSICI